MTGVKVLDLSNPPERGIIVFNHNEVDSDTLRAALKDLPSGVKWCCAVNDVDNALAILSEEDLNKAGWYRK